MAKWTKKATEAVRGWMRTELDKAEGSHVAMLPMRHDCDDFCDSRKTERTLWKKWQRSQGKTQFASGTREKLSKIELPEWTEWQERQARHRKAEPDYDSKFNRPSRDTTEKIWAILRAHAFPEGEITPTPYHTIINKEDHSQREFAARQALVVALDTFVAAGLSHRQIAHLKVFDALCRAFSDNYIDLSPTVESIRDTLNVTVRRCRRDLMLLGIRSKPLWEVLISWERNPLFQVRKTGSKGAIKRVLFDGRVGNVLEDFNTILDADPQYVRAERSGIRILFDEPPKNRYERYKVCAERPYNVVKLGPESLGVLERQENVILYLDVDAFAKDYKDAHAIEQKKLEDLEKNYGVKADISNNPRITGRHLDEWAPPRAPWWSERAEYVYFRSIELGILRKQQGELTPADLRNYRKLERCRTHIKNIPKWLENHGAEGSHKHVVDWLRRNEDQLSGDTPEQSFLRVDKSMRVWRDEVHELLEEYDTAVLHQAVFRNVDEQVRGQIGLHPIRSGFRRVLTRRYQPLNFWPTYVTSKNHRARTRNGDDETDSRPPAEDVLESYREKWFKVKDDETGDVCGLAGFDISSSQMQIIAVFLGDRELEEATTAPMTEPSFKQRMARWLWELHTAGTIRLRNGKEPYMVGGRDKDIDERLQELVKELLMRVSYGGSWWKVEMDQRCHPKTYGAAWESGSAGQFIREFNKKYPGPQRFREICRRVARNAYNTDAYRGFVLRDPFDKQEVRWNPVARAEGRVPGNEGFSISLPSGFQAKRGSASAYEMGKARARGLLAVIANTDGDYPVDRAELERMLAPCLVHLMDAYFSSLVMEALTSKGITVFVGIHDCWLVPKNQTALLKIVMEEAANKWYSGLGPIYQALLSHLKNEKKYKQYVESAYETWEKRKKDNGWKLVFRAKQVG